MAEKPRPKEKPKRKPKFDDKAESERFVEAARKLGIEEAGPAFEQAFRKVVSQKDRP
jgi:hypothetical protein